MIEALTGALLALLAAQQFLHGRQVKAERAHHSEREDTYRAHVERLENQIVRLKVDPVQAVTYAAPEGEEQPSVPVDDSPYTDVAWAEYLERNSQ